MGLPTPSRFPRFPLLLTALRDTLQVPLCFDVLSENRKSGRRAASFFLPQSWLRAWRRGSQLGGGTYGPSFPSCFPNSSPFPHRIRDTLQMPLCFDVSSGNRKSGRRAASFFPPQSWLRAWRRGSQLGGGTYGPSYSFPLSKISPFPHRPS